MRIDKLFSSLGILSRSECKKAIKAGHIMVGDRIVKSSDETVDTNADLIFYKGSQIDCSFYVYYMLNKPQGVVTAKSDIINETVFSLIDDKRPTLSAVGRLDKDTTGLLLLTNDGILNHRLLSSKYPVKKEYIVKTDGFLSDSDIDALQSGVDIGDDKKTLPADADILGETSSGSILSLTICEGRYHQVKRMLSSLGKPVLSLHRRSFGSLILDASLLAGEFRSLTIDEINALKSDASMD